MSWEVYLKNDAPIPWGIYFQDSASPNMEGIIELFDHVWFYIIIVLGLVVYILWSELRGSWNNKISYKYLTHGTLLELVWTITPALILLGIAFPSLKLLYLMDDVLDPALTVKAIGHQWYWSYEYADVYLPSDEYLEFDSYMLPDSDLEKGQLRIIDVDQRLVLPELTHVRFIVSSTDVIHNFAVPALGLRLDGNPGRLNQMSCYIQRTGVYYGFCSELCGVAHSAIPICIEAVNMEEFVNWITDQIS